MSDHMQPNGRYRHCESSNSTRAHTERINVLAIWKFSRPPQLDNNLTKRTRRLLYGRFGNETFRKLKLIVSVRESTSLQFGNSPVLLNSTTSSRNGCVVCYMAGSATRRSQSLGINVVAIRKLSCPPQFNNKLTKRMRCLLYGSFGNETWQRLSGTLQEQTASVQQ